MIANTVEPIPTHFDLEVGNRGRKQQRARVWVVHREQGEEARLRWESFVARWSLFLQMRGPVGWLSEEPGDRPLPTRSQSLLTFRFYLVWSVVEYPGM